ncbi:CsbD family protein [Glycomyces tarimensis]
MSGFDKAKDKGQQAKGEAKERVGEATDNEELEAEGQREQMAGEAKEAAHGVRDKATQAAHDAKEKLQGDEGERESEHRRR